MLLVMLSWITFWLDIDAAPARISLGTTLVLSIVTLVTSARNMLPKIAYNTVSSVVAFTLKIEDLFSSFCFLLQNGLE